MIEAVKDSAKTHWVNRAPVSVRPFLQLSRLDRPVGYWLLALPGWIGLAFAGLSHGLVWTDLKWAALILIGAIAMRGAGCTYNDIVDQDLDAQVERTALRPLPAGTVTTKQAWIWLFVQCAVGLVVLLMLPRLAQIVSLLSIPLVAVYPFMKRITWFPQVWLGLTFNWAVLVAYAAKTGSLSPALFILYLGLMFWTVGYDTIYACQDIEDDAFVGIKSTARRFGGRVKLGVVFCYAVSLTMIVISLQIAYKIRNSIIFENRVQPYLDNSSSRELLLPGKFDVVSSNSHFLFLALFTILPLSIHFLWQTKKLEPDNGKSALRLFLSNRWAAFFLIVMILLFAWMVPNSR
ncbi:4-hydroxybenzoate octaprenyltransferase [Litorimonas sp. WD9-15]|uniref:4-hydroxybenzoate octaprenyltransferase n=1 Tax=Litorimonas sp. WD9-15 TaxID=3418716 RepID=UPI003CFEABA3